MLHCRNSGPKTCSMDKDTSKTVTVLYQTASIQSQYKEKNPSDAEELVIPVLHCITIWRHFIPTLHRHEWLSRMGESGLGEMTQPKEHIRVSLSNIFQPQQRLLKCSQVIESLRLEEASKIIKSNLCPNTTRPIKPYQKVPCLLILWTL